MLKVVIPEPITSLNKGEAAILEGLYEALRACGDFAISVYSPPDWFQDDKRNYDGRYTVVDGVDLLDIANKYLEKPAPRTRSHFFRTWGALLGYSVLYRLIGKSAMAYTKDNLLKAIMASDLILAGHDGMLAYEHFYLVLAGNIMNKPVAIYGGGNDGTTRQGLKLRLFFRYMAARSLTFFVRDQGTRDYFVMNDAAPENVRLFPDPAVLLPPSCDMRVREILQNESVPDREDVPLYGLIPVRGGIVFDKSFSHEKDKVKKHGLRVAFWVEIMKHLLQTTNAHFVFLPHCIGPVGVNDDRIMNRDIYHALPEGKERITLIENEYSPGDLKGLVKRFDYVLGERTHGLIGAFSVGTPHIALTVEEDLRMHNIVNRMFGQKTFNMNHPDLEALKEILTQEWQCREETARVMKEHAARILDSAHEASHLLRNAVERACS